jgi:uncharacterized protein (TIGR03437 family)
MNTSRFFTLLAVLFLTIVPARAADSVFLPNAFVGNWATTLQSSQGPGSTTLQITAIPAAQGRTLIDSLGDPNFSANNCPAVNQKTEFYQAIPQQQDSTFYGCTNGATLNLRFAHSATGDRGTIRITTTNIGPPASFSGMGSSIFQNFITLDAAYLSGAVTTPLGRVAASYIFSISPTPPAGATLVPGTTQSFTVTVRYLLGFGAGTVTTLLYNGNIALGVSTPIVVPANSPERLDGLVISNIVIPQAASLTLRTELRQDVGTLLGVVETQYGVLQSDPLSVAPTILTEQRDTGTAPFASDLQITATSGAPIPFTATIVNGSTWVSVTDQGTIVNGAATLPVSFKANSLAPGFYSDTIRIVTANKTLDVPVALTIASPTPTLSVDPDGLLFESRQGQGSTDTQHVILTAIGGPVSWSANAIAGAGLIQFTPLGGTATPGNPSDLHVTLAPNATNSAGDAYAQIEISRPGQSSDYITVVSNVIPTSEPVEPDPSSASLFFVATQGGTDPQPQAFTLNVSELTDVPFSVAVAPGATWLSAFGLSPTTSTSQPANVFVSPTITGLAPGVYIGLVNITIGPLTRGTRAVLIVRPAGTQSSATRRATGCTPARVVVTETKVPEAYSSPAGWPQDLLAHLYDDCGTPLPRGSIIATFNNGDAPLRLINDGVSGDYFGTWTPSGALLANTIVKLSGSFAGLASSTLEIRGGVTPNAEAAPALVESGVLQAYNAIVGSPLAPGIIVQVYGRNLSTVTETTPAPLPAEYKGTELLVGGLSAPFYYVRPDVLIAQLPIGLQPGRTYPVVAKVNGALSAPLNIFIEAARPGVANWDAGHLIAQHTDYTLVTEQKPAVPGETLMMYLVGMGATNPPVEAGTFTPLQLVHAVTQPTVTIDGQPAQVQYAGLTPTAIGLYQINFVVPLNARSADLDVVITQNGVPANPTKLVVRK